jgi:hypothetical protein
LTSHKATEPISVVEPLPVVLELMRALATQRAGRVHQSGAVYGSAWSYAHVRLVEHNLAGICHDFSDRQDWRRWHPDARRQSCHPSALRW